ncbi:hypothetical protein [Trabulsiella odontotermitis]|uniref:Lipoprotein n=1 Tax=Trabulsiella odontotermitis TaxID=379893 RepID=A0A0L0GY64_9ENTR|nr:hypothetical protein [Trabulsiella odontotermitis]KNC93872.1 hypothetical protein GM31_17580 [Trabulsiella odontotermitis]
MRNSLKMFGGVTIVVAMILACSWPWIKMELAESAHYTEQDKREYDFYTPDVLKKKPRISDRYVFDFTNIIGPARHVYALKFYDTSDTSKIEAYLASIGYKQIKCDFETMCWQGTDPQESIYVNTMKGDDMVIVQIAYDFT